MFVLGVFGLLVEFWDVDLEAFQQRFAISHEDYPVGLLNFAMDALKGLQAILEPAHQHFGYRTAEEILTFLGTNHQHGAAVMSREEALDQAILMKALPKVRGQDSPEFRACLEKLAEFLSGNHCQASATKIAAMLAELKLTGATRFWR